MTTPSFQRKCMKTCLAVRVVPLLAQTKPNPIGISKRDTAILVKKSNCFPLLWRRRLSLRIGQTVLRVGIRVKWRRRDWKWIRWSCIVRSRVRRRCNLRIYWMRRESIECLSIWWRQSLGRLIKNVLMKKWEGLDRRNTTLWTKWNFY